MTVRVQLKLRGINAIMKSQPVTNQLFRVGRRAAGDAGANFEFVSRPHKWTVRGFVQPANAEGRREQSENAVLERVMGSR